MAKTCTKCKHTKDDSGFGNRKGKLATMCKNCVNAIAREYRQNHLLEIRNRDKKRRRNRKPYLDSYSLTPKYHFSYYRSNAKIKKLDFTLTFEDFIKFWKNPCYYCGRVLKTIGLDRIDSSKGYIITNIVPCCSDCNYAKLEMTGQEFIELCRLVVENSLERIGI